MKIVGIVGLIFLLIGVGFFWLTNSIIMTPSLGGSAVVVTHVAKLLFMFISSSFLGVGAGLLIYWILQYGKALSSAVFSVTLSFATFFGGMGASIALRELWLSTHVFLTFTFLSVTLFVSALLHVAMGVTNIFTQVKWKKLFTWKKRK